MEHRFPLYALDILSKKEFNWFIPRGFWFHEGGSCVGKERSWWLLLPGPHCPRGEGRYLLGTVLVKGSPWDVCGFSCSCHAPPVLWGGSPVIHFCSLPTSYFHLFPDDDDWLFTVYRLLLLQAEAAWKSIQFSNDNKFRDSPTKQVPYPHCLLPPGLAAKSIS